MSTDGGVAADERVKKLYALRVRSKHQMRLTMPSASCRCGGFQAEAPEDLSPYHKRDWLLDRYNEHRLAMAREKRRLWHAKK